MQAEIEQLSAGLCFSITDQQSYYMWQFNASDPQHPRLRPHRWLGGGVSLLGEVELPSTVKIQAGHTFRVRLEIEDEAYVKTYIDDILVDERSGSFAFGRIGFRQAHDDAYGKTEIAWFDDVSIRVKSGSGPGDVVFSEDFSASNPFSDGSIISGRLKVTGQMSHDILAWLREVPDGLGEVKSEKSRVKNDETVYNLGGQKINGRVANGIVVHGGKKYLTRQ
jgi:alpha-L-rhamnosidase